MPAYSRARVGDLIGCDPMSVYRWIREGTLRASVNPGVHGGSQGMEFSPDDVRLGVMLHLYRGDGRRSFRVFRAALSSFWYDRPCALVVVTDRETVTRCDSVEHAVSVAVAARGVATILWPDRLLGWA